MTKQLNRMTQANFFKLCQWLQPQVLANGDTMEKLAATADAVLDFPVTRANIRAAMETLEMEIPGAPKTDAQKLQIIGHALLNLYAQLKETPPKELLDLAKQ